MISSAFAAETAHAAEQSSIFGTAEFWVAAAFILVVGLALRPILRKVAGGLDSRAGQIRSKLDEARKLREDAQALLAEYQRKQRDAMQEAEGIIAHARSEAERLKKEGQAALEASVARREQQAVDRIAQAEAQALAQVRNQAVDIAIAAAGKLIAGELKADKANALIEDAIKTLPAKLH